MANWDPIQIIPLQQEVQPLHQFAPVEPIFEGAPIVYYIDPIPYKRVGDMLTYYMGVRLKPKKDGSEWRDEEWITPLAKLNNFITPSSFTSIDNLFLPPVRPIRRSNFIDDYKLYRNPYLLFMSYLTRVSPPPPNKI